MAKLEVNKSEIDEIVDGLTKAQGNIERLANKLDNMIVDYNDEIQMYNNMLKNAQDLRDKAVADAEEYLKQEGLKEDETINVAEWKDAWEQTEFTLLDHFETTSPPDFTDAAALEELATSPE